MSINDQLSTVKLHNDPTVLSGQKKSLFAFHKIICSQASSVLWETVIASPGVSMDGNKLVEA